MGYDLHITRREFWADDGNNISRREVDELVKNDPELEWDKTLGKDMIRFTGNSLYDDPWLQYCEGELNTKWPDRELIRKMIQIAQSLQANVQGDDGEYYEDLASIPDDWDQNLHT
jgi:uncharacterized protein YfaT (DUF1175 family)